MALDLQQKLWQDVVDFSILMLAKARGGEWDVLTTMVDERQTKLEKFFSQNVPETMADSVAKGIVSIREMDATITHLTLAERASASGEMGLLIKRKQASRAFSDPRHNGG